MDDHKFGLSPEDDLPIEAAPTPPPPAEAVASAESLTPIVPLAPAPPAAPVAAAAPMEPTPPAPPLWQGTPQAPMAPAPVDISGVGTLATYGQRAGGWLLDVLIMAVLFFIIFIVGMVIGLFTSGSTSNILSGVATGFFVVLLLGLSWGYPIIFLVKRGQTPGMKIVKIHCVTLDGHAITWGRSIGRSASQLLLSIIPFGLGNIIDLLFPLWDVKRQTLHDKMAGTLVVQDLPH